MILPANIVTLNTPAKTIYLLGTAHVSEKSVADVDALIDVVQPDTVCVELCQTRYETIIDRSRWQKLDIFKIIRQGKTLLLMASLALGIYQRRLGKELGVQPGAELIAAVHKARRIGARVVLIDRDIQITLRRTWASLSFWKKMMLLSTILEGLVVRQKISEADIEQLKEKANLSQLLTEFAQVLPEVKRPLLDERDQYLISGVEQAPGVKVVAVVGAAHVGGMQQALGQPVDRAALEMMPPPSRWAAALKWLIPALIVALFAYGVYQHRTEKLADMLFAWVLPTSLLCGFFTALAGARPLSILSGILAAPLTTIHPLIGAGMVVGLVEAWLRKPTVADAERINEDVHSLRGIYRNRFTRVLLVTLLSSVGAALGMWVGLSWLIALVA